MVNGSILLNLACGKQVALDLSEYESVSDIKSALVALYGYNGDFSIFQGLYELDASDLTCELLHDGEDVVVLNVHADLCGGGKKRKKKQHTTPKKIKHKKKKVKLSVLKFYKVENDGKINRLLKDCPAESCGRGVFMALHHNRTYCGRCGLTYLLNNKSDE
ncbi:bifunctional Zinc-binding ribosomal protein/Ribosomal protein S27a/S27a-like superfamily [Babesia duncani]|uniref:Bifunctional Zinc-binding ribosomal protein/Ribosomal protein S27a/S27a-like superfamily n=1 Tax=Babesia duncani TaxID=323732 RepID=A0AAD9UNY8_9APIC|nr:bifunctional Zinc-binding ribosomal protein/Ribosomal protein S27a/S27a-like superfamily [Babesia duncani]